jgi:hypothetical protein
VPFSRALGCGAQPTLNSPFDLRGLRFVPTLSADAANEQPGAERFFAWVAKPRSQTLPIANGPVDGPLAGKDAANTGGNRRTNKEFAASDL